MKTVLNILLAAAAVWLVIGCYQSLMIPIQFNNEVAKRDAVVIQRMKDIRTLQEEYQAKYGVYAASWDQLVNFAKHDSLAIVNKIGSLTDDQLKEGLNEEKAWMYLCNPSKYSKEIAQFGLSKATFSRDSTYVTVLEKDSILCDPDSIKFIPVFAEGCRAEACVDTIELNTGTLMSASGYEMPLFEAKVPFKAYLNDLNEQELQNRVADRELQDKFPGIQVGDATQANNNAGNWE